MVVENPGALALVVAPQIGGYTLHKVLMDGGSSINILYYDTFLRMSLTHKQLQPSNTVFHGIVPGKSARPIGKIYLEVAFRNSKNFRSEIIPFEVVKLESPYHAILGRPAYAQFMACPCYIYLKLKMPSPTDQSRSTEAGPWLLNASNNTSLMPSQLVPKRTYQHTRRRWTRQTPQS